MLKKEQIGSPQMMTNRVPSVDPNKVGGNLVRIGAMQHWQVEKVLVAQRSGDARLFGEIAIELGYISDAALKSYVDFVQP